MTDASLRLDHLQRTFGRVRAVDDLSLEVPSGSFLTLLGPSGCGKSTTLSLIAGLERPDGGRVILGDQDITDEPPNERRMAMVFQNYALYPHMTAYGNIAFGLRLQRRPKAEIDTRVRQVAAMLDIGHLLDRKPGQMSGGQQQRVALGRALVKEPALFLLDEPFSNLDAALRSRMRTEVKHLHLRLGTTSVFVTHDQEEAMTLSDIIAVMREGKLVQAGSQAEVYGRPADLYVATFVGKPRMGLLEGSLGAEGTDIVFTAPGVRLVLGSAEALGISDAANGETVLGVRAEDLRIRLDADAAGPRVFDARVQLLEPVGSDTYVELAVGGTTLVSRAAPDIPVVLDQQVRAEAVGRIHLFDKATGVRINR
jgi:multiple sugar transport system ATP-binding protein